MGKELDFGRDPMPKSGVYVVRAVEGGRKLGTVKANTVDEAVVTAEREIPATATVDFTVTEERVRKV